MVEIFSLDISLKFLFKLMLSLAFFVGILLMVSQEAMQVFHKNLQKEFGLKRRIAPKLEDDASDIVDRVLIKYRVLAGLLIAMCSFFLLLIYK